MMKHDIIPADFLKELERRFFWWQSIGNAPRGSDRIVAQAMSLGSFDDVRWLETVIGPNLLAQLMLHAEPGWISDRSWEFWRGRLTLATGLPIPETPPRRSFDAEAL